MVSPTRTQTPTTNFQNRKKKKRSMAISFNHLFHLLPLLFLITIPAIAASHANITATPLIQETCEKTLHKDLCLLVLTSTEKGSTADLKTLADIAIEAAIRKANRTAGHIAILLEKDHPPTLQQCISDCSESYEDAMDQLNDALGTLDKLPGNDEDDTVTWLSAAMSDVETCEEGCKMQPVEKNVLTERNMEFQNLCSNALAIVKLLPAAAN